MSILDHIVLYIILFSIFFIVTRLSQSTINKNYWTITSILIILYSIIVGCRYGWGVDYFWYKQRIEEPYFYVDEDFGFRWINLFFKDLGIGYVGVYIVYSLVFIVGAYILLRHYKQNKYMLALFLPATLLLSTFTIRQSFAQSFVFVALYLLIKKKWVGMLVMLFITYSIHPAALLIFIICGGFYLLSGVTNKLPPLLFTIALYVFASVYVDFFNKYITTYSSIVTSYISLGSSKFQSYLNNSVMWFGEEGQKDHWRQGNLTLILSMVFDVSIIYLGNIALKYKQSRPVLCMYYSTVFGLIFTRIFFLFGSIRRIMATIGSFYFIPLGYAILFVTTSFSDLTQKEKVFSVLSLLGIIIYLILYFGRFILQSPGCMFFWNNY